MFYKIKENVIYRKYEGYGYLTDNSLFGYKSNKPQSWFPGEKYLSESAAVMIDALEKKPISIDLVLDRLLKIFNGVSRNELKDDVILFFDELVKDGFLNKGDTFEECEMMPAINTEDVNTNSNFNSQLESISETSSKDLFKQNDFLRSIHIEVASECNERCVHCYIPHELKTNSMNLNLFNNIIDEGRNMNIINVTLSGGEPLLHKDIIQILKKCRESDLSVNLLSNLTLLSSEVLEEMKRNPLLSVQTSIYSMDKNVHDSITKVKGSFDETMKALQKIISNGIPVQISCPVMKQNRTTFKEVVEWGNDNGIVVATEYVIFGSYDHTNSNLINRLSLDEVSDVLSDDLNKEYAKYYFDNAKEKECLTKEDAVCSICRYNFCVSVDGYVYPCVGWNSNVLGNLNSNSISEIWNNSKEVVRLKNVKMDSFPKCLKCEDRGYCTICMMTNSNESVNGDEFEIDNYHCKVAKLKHDKILKILNKK